MNHRQKGKKIQEELFAKLVTIIVISSKFALPWFQDKVVALTLGFYQSNFSFWSSGALFTTLHFLLNL
jgi:hypothetical protein